MSSEIASTSAVHVWANDERAYWMNQLFFNLWFCEFFLIRTSALHLKQYSLSSSPCGSSRYRPCGWVRVTSLSAPLTTTFYASPRPPGWDGRWVRLRNTLYGCDPPYWLTHLLLFAFIETRPLLRPSCFPHSISLIFACLILSEIVLKREVLVIISSRRQRTMNEV